MAEVQELVIIPFDREFAALSAEQFVEQVLIESLAATQVSVGENFRFGSGARVPGVGEGFMRLTHDGELLAVAEPRGDELQPVVVFAG